MWTGSENKIELYMFRHGSTRMNEEHRYLGTTNESLSPLGIAEVEKRKYSQDYEMVFCGPMKRCIETADILFPEISRIEIPEWTEIDFGDFEGRNYEELSGNPDYQRWIDSGGTIAFPNGESREAFIERSKEGFVNMVEYINSLLEQEQCSSCGPAQQGMRVAAVMHGGNIMAILYSMLGGEYFDYQIKPAHGYHCTITAGNEIKIIQLEEIR